MTSTQVSIEDVRLVFRNFSGKGGRYNREGDRNFCVILPDELALRMKEEGWNVKYLKPRDDEEYGPAYIQVKMKFGKYPPKVVLVSSSGKMTLDEDTVDTLDHIDIRTADILIRPYNWTMTDARSGDIVSGVTAYVKTMYVVADEDEFEAKYA